MQQKAMVTFSRSLGTISKTQGSIKSFKDCKPEPQLTERSQQTAIIPGSHQDAPRREHGHQWSPPQVSQENTVMTGYGLGAQHCSLQTPPLVKSTKVWGPPPIATTEHPPL